MCSRVSPTYFLVNEVDLATPMISSLGGSNWKYKCMRATTKKMFSNFVNGFGKKKKKKIREAEFETYRNNQQT